MTLELNQVTGRVQQMASVMAQQQRERERRLEELRDLLHQHAQPDDALKAKIAKAKTLFWIGAEPRSGEPLDAAIAAPELARETVVIAADGSQIHPDRHATALYYVVNVGSIVFRSDTGEAPEIHSQARLGFYGDTDNPTDREADREQSDADDQPLLAADVDSRRDLAEVRELAQLAEAERVRSGGDLDVAIVAVADGPLMQLRTLYEADEAKQREQVRQHATQMARLQAARVPVGGYIDRPGSALVMRLLRLAGSEVTTDQLRRRQDIPEPDPDDPVDRSLFQFLEPGQRSALFYNTSRVNEQYEAAGQRIAFFYMNVGGPGRGQIGRVEVPHWVADDAAMLGQVQAALFAQSQVTAGYPYVLARAHELAVITMEERSELERMVQTAMVTQGLEWEPSHKFQEKQMTGSKRWLGRRR